MSVPPGLLNLVQPWASLYGNSQPISVGVAFLHLAAMMIGGGRAVAADADLLSARRADPALADRLHRAHRVVVPALVLVAVTGAAMATADVETFAESSAFGVKLALVALLAANGALLWRAERRLVPGGARALARARLSAGASLVLWLLTVLAGCWLQVAA